jgi:hypothetical protein
VVGALNVDVIYLVSCLVYSAPVRRSFRNGAAPPLAVQYLSPSKGDQKMLDATVARKYDNSKANNFNHHFNTADEDASTSMTRSVQSDITYDSPKRNDPTLHQQHRSLAADASHPTSGFLKAVKPQASHSSPNSKTNARVWGKLKEKLKPIPIAPYQSAK